VPGLAKTVGNRPTNSPEETEPPLGGTNPGTSQPAKQGFINLILSPHTAGQPHPKERGLALLSYDQKNNKFNFSNIKIERLYTEDEVDKIVREKCGELEQKLERIKSIVG